MIEHSTLRIVCNERTYGMGFLVAKNLAVIFAHVVADIRETIQVQITGQQTILSAQVIPEYYRDRDNGDITFLRLESVPENITPLRLSAVEHSSSGNPFQAFGYPNVGAQKSKAVSVISKPVVWARNFPASKSCNQTLCHLIIGDGVVFSGREM